MNSTRSYSESFILPAVVDSSSDFSYVENGDSFHTHIENSVKQILDIRMKGEWLAWPNDFPNCSWNFFESS